MAGSPEPTKVEIIPVSRSGKDLSRFLALSHDIYRKDPHWVAPLPFDARRILSNSNPFFAHAQMQLWIAHRAGRDVGRIAAILDRHFSEALGEPVAGFGFFECEKNPHASRELLAGVLQWARERGARRVLGPLNPSTNEECGLLVDGFDSSPQFMMSYNPRYYEDLILDAGFVSAKNLLAYQISAANCPLERVNRIAAKTLARNPGLRVTLIRRRTLAGDLVRIKEVYNSAWRQNWGFVPLTEAEIDFLAARLKPLLREGLVCLAELADEPVGFLLMMPDFNRPLRPLRGRLLSPQLFDLLMHVYGNRLPTTCRVVTLGVKAAYRNRGIEAVMLAEGMKNGLRLGFTEAEASWVLEDNLPMRRLLRSFGGTVYKTYRIYERTI